MGWSKQNLSKTSDFQPHNRYIHSFWLLSSDTFYHSEILARLKFQLFTFPPSVLPSSAIDLSRLWQVLAAG
jgi:hypothetical protein